MSRIEQFSRILRQIRAWVQAGEATPQELADVLSEMFRRDPDAAAAAMMGR